MAVADRPSQGLPPWQDPKAQPYILVDHVSKNYDGLVALNNAYLSVYKGEFFALLGPSGCGKTTLLRILSGFEAPSSGKVYIDGSDMTAVAPYERPVNLMFQSYALFPHMTVEQNIAFGLKQEGLPKTEIRDRVSSILELVHLTKHSRRKPEQLSGGQRQRVALARCLVKQPKLLLLDEPLGALDRQLREKTQFELVSIQEKLGITFIMVTHDQEEAMTMSTRIAVMEEGRIRQVGTPTEIYEYPNSYYVADFIGDMNIFEGIVAEETEEHVVVHSEEAGTTLYVSSFASAPVGAHVAVAIRPEKVVISSNRKHVGPNFMKGIVSEIAYLGDVSIYHVELPNKKKVLATVTNQFRMAERPINWDDQVYLSWRPESAVILTG
ncbi:ABC transporter ATP-binding protein [Candidatus Nucleicultrix amoebiphila]|jgi:putrescine transport system ATP-binding protein|uniref:Spermidine/putrescine import ATP-binding protein PotA n=1 Tax=Candidatus Nucleicultrix amoebiphila FS5 TaxID=1414854 RepID=A0A1W6N6J6_9PROT|nr:polyamine ABC transporter ATP-binding protein [Candidatus Nucleicultrix amoebiphila]ARN85431.1 ABC transporter ATP-binding protein [Candidatus Nucleicultrix amoebiphila FS5]